MVLQNIVTLVSGVPARMHFTDHRVESLTITDPHTGAPVLRQRLAFDVDELNGAAVSSRFSSLAKAFADKMTGYLPNKKYRDYDFVVTWTDYPGQTYRNTYLVLAIPRT